MPYKRISLLTILTLATGTAAIPQSPSEEFNKFRQKILSDYADFKARVLDHYADFLEGEWHEFEPILVEKEKAPKPVVPLQAPAEPQKAPENPKLPEANLSPVTLPGLNSVPDTKPALKNYQPKKIDLFAGKGDKSNYEMAVEKIPDPGFAFGPNPDQIKAPSPGEAWIQTPQLGDAKYDGTAEKVNGAVGGGALGGLQANVGKTGLAGNGHAAAAKYDGTAEKVNGAIGGGALGGLQANVGKTGLAGNGHAASAKFASPKFTFDFYGMEAVMPETEFEISESMADVAVGAAGNWRLLDGQKDALETSRQLFGLAQQMGLNGYLTYRLAEQYVAQRFPGATEAARTSTVHYLLSQMGYDVRLASVGKDLAVLMMPFDQKEVFSKYKIQLGDDKKNYTVLEPEGYSFEDLSAKMKGGISTCILPADAKGKTSDLRLTGLTLPMKGKDFEITGGDMTIRGEVNENLMKMLYRYPHMPMGDFASSWLDNDLRKDILLQVKMQLAGMSEKEAVNKLMKFFHNGFKYSTDQASHGFEKPYFLEENLYYDSNDCEDRAMFFSYLVWNALDLPCQLIQYPGHESTAVASNSGLDGYYYVTDGTKYFSADPTYVGSHWGMIATNYRNAPTTIDKLYK